MFFLVSPKSQHICVILSWQRVLHHGTVWETQDRRQLCCDGSTLEAHGTNALDLTVDESYRFNFVPL